MNYSEAIEKIDSLLVFGSRLGLDRIKKLLDMMGNPQDKLKFVHIAGTNGKGSVSNMTASVLTQAGCRTGLFTSPHITGFGERMQIDFCRISESELIKQVEKLFPLVEQLKNDNIIITEFEFVTAIAFNWFAENNCDVVVLETGMGGRFDSTNVIKTPLCSIITSVSLDHTAILGDTLSKIAFEKAGIIKKGGNVVFALQEEEVNDVILKAVYEHDNTLFAPANLTVIKSDINGTFVKYGDLDIHIPLVGDHQISNLRLVLGAVEALRKLGIDIRDSHISNGIAKVKMPARFEVLKHEPLTVIDGAHNPGGLKALSCALDKYLANKKIVCVMGMLKDKDCKNSLSYLKGKLWKLITTTVKDNPRRQTASQLKETAQAYFEDITAEEDFEKAADLALDIVNANPDAALLVCGSLYLASDIRNYLLKKDSFNTKKLKIVIPDKKTISVSDISFEKFSQLGEVTEYDLSSFSEIDDRVKDADIILCNKTPMNEQTLHNAKNLKYIGLFATGYNNIDLNYTNSRQITVCNAADYSTYAVAQHTFALILHICSRVSEYNEFVQKGGWVNSDVFSPFVFPTAELFGKTIGIVGFGNIGKTVAQTAKAFGMNVLFYSRTPKDAPNGMVQTDLNTLAENSDFVTVHCPLNTDSYKMFNDELFAKFKKGAVFINTARGGVLDEHALVNALKNGILKAAAVDVSDCEPMSYDSPLLGVPNLIVTPHVAWAPLETRERLTDIVYDNLKSYLDGCPKNVVSV